MASAGSCRGARQEELHLSSGQGLSVGHCALFVHLLVWGFPVPLPPLCSQLPSALEGQGLGACLWRLGDGTGDAWERRCQGLGSHQPDEGKPGVTFWLGARDLVLLETLLSPLTVVVSAGDAGRSRGAGVAEPAMRRCTA